MRIITSIIAVTLTVFLGVAFVWAFNPPTQSPPNGNGAMSVDSSNNIGIGVSAPLGAKLDVNGQIMIRGGSPQVGYVLTAGNNNGLASWQQLPGGHDPITLAGENYLTLSGQQIMANALTDGNIPNNITLTNLTQLQNRDINDTTGNLPLSRTSGNLSESRITAGNDNTILTSNNGLASWQQLPGGHDPITLAGENYLTLSGQQIMANALTDGNIPNNITLTNLTQLQNRDINDTTGNLPLSRTSGNLSESRITAGNDNTILTSNNGLASWQAPPPTFSGSAQANCNWTPWMSDNGGGTLYCPAGQVMTGFSTYEFREKSDDRRTWFTMYCCGN